MELHKKIMVITCKDDPDYIRARTLRAGLAAIPGVQLVVVKNRSRHLGRFPEMFVRILIERIRHRPDSILLTFRGYEWLAWVLLIAWRTPVIFDEFVNPELVVREHRMQKRGIVGVLMTLWGPCAPIYYWLLRRTACVLSDTQAHADYSANLSGITPQHYRAVPVSTDEAVFKHIKSQKNTEFSVFYYGSMLPLHGLDTVLKAAELLRDEAITFSVVGGGSAAMALVDDAVSRGAKVLFEPWVPFEKLPSRIAAAAVCLGGPFGNTEQSQLVITGKTYQFLASGAVTIVGQNVAHTNVFKDRHNCLVVPQANPQALAEAITWAKAHPTQIKDIKVAARKLYGRELSIAKVTEILRSSI